MIRNILIFSLLAFVSLHTRADGLDELHEALQTNSQIQEKVYVHTDNTCYFIGDTLWFKAYVLRADDLHPTDMSRLLYVELLSPDGLVVERQRVIVSDQGYTCGQFVLQDSLYSGYYELRAYTRWMLNFSVSHRRYSRDDRHLFYNNQMAADFFREWDGFFSRVIPIYSKPENYGDYDGKYMYERPKQDVVRQPKEKLQVSFFPEGGQLVMGLVSRVAFEITDQYGQAVAINGELSDGTPIQTTHMGRGIFQAAASQLSGKNELKARFNWRGRNYTFNLPKIQPEGIVLRLDKQSVELKATPAFQGKPVGLAVLCRGRLVHFEKLILTAGPTVVDLSSYSLPTGVNEVLVFDEVRNVLASRLFFVNNHDLCLSAQVNKDGKYDFEPYEAIPLTVTFEKGISIPCFSLSVRDAHTDDPTYNDGNMLTEMLLSSDLKGFVAHPAYYFESDDEEHQSRLDLLMMVQGWRRYKPVKILRYEPEHSFTVEGSVYKMLGLETMQRDQIAGLNSRESVFTEQQATNDANSGLFSGGTFMETERSAESSDAAAKATSSVEEVDFSSFGNSELGINHGGLKHEVLVEAELNANGQTVGGVQLTRNGGHFVFELPPYYGSAILFVKAYERKDSVKKSMETGIDKGRLDEDAYADFYVKRDLFYPVFAREYSWYEKHMPDFQSAYVAEQDVDLEGSRLDGDHTLDQVDVRARRRGRRAIDYSKPAYVIDAYDLYNLATDRGLSWGLVNMGSFPSTAAYAVYGNMGRYNKYNVRARLADGPQLERPYTFYQNYQAIQETVRNRAEGAIFKDLHLYRLQNFRFYTDYEPRNADSLYTESVNRDDITLVYETIPNDARRTTYRDRHYILPGFAEPTDFYSPDYSQARPVEPTDYRRTLYWNPNAHPDADGRYHVTFYNNSRQTRIRVSLAGITSDGKVITSE